MSSEELQRSYWKQHLEHSVSLQQEEPVKSGFLWHPNPEKGYVHALVQHNEKSLQLQVTRKTEPPTSISEITECETQGSPKEKNGTMSALPASRDLETGANM